MQIYFDSILIILQRFNDFAHFWRILFAKLHLLNFVWNFDYNFDVLDEIIGIIIESRYIGICPIIDKIIDIGRRLPQIIGDLRELSAKLSISKMTGELSKIYRYRKKWLIAHPYSQRNQVNYLYQGIHMNDIYNKAVQGIRIRISHLKTSSAMIFQWCLPGAFYRKIFFKNSN